MTRKHILALLALAPAAALAQAAAIQAARDAHKTSDAGNARIENAIDRATGASAADAPAAKGVIRTAPAVPTDVEVRVAPAEGGAAAADAGRGTVPPPDTYTVRPGDTLWDLSGRFLNNPWYWPKVWSYNPEITNPHWIEPGNVLRFFPGPDQGPVQVEPVSGGSAPVAADEPESAQPAEDAFAPPKELEDFSKADLHAPPSAEEQDVVAVAGPYRIGQAPRRTLYAERTTFVTPRELEESGTIRAAFEERSMLATLDKAYATFKGKADVKRGETYLLYRTVKPVRHPITGELFGYQSDVLGSARVTSVDGDTVTLEIVTAIDPIERGAMLGPWTERIYRPVPEKPNARSLTGVIVASPRAQVTQLAESQVVFIDRGKADGVEEGNRLSVVRAGDPLNRSFARTQPWDPSLPKETVGELLVVDVREHASAALVVRSIVELQIGDRFETKAAPTAVGSAAR